MSGIYGSLRQYSPSVVAQKTEQLQYRAPVKILDTGASDITAVIDGALYNQQEGDALVNLYRKYGIDCLKYLNGDFAFVIYDPVAQRLFGAVDRIGSKP